MSNRYRVIIVLLLFVALSYFIDLGCKKDWTGFKGYTNSKSEVIPPKKLWDWMDLLIVPCLLAVGGWWLNKSQKESDQLIETDKQRQKSLEDYFDCMTDLLLKHNLRDTNNSEARSIARTRTLVLLRMLDGGRKGQAIQFLYESSLINKNPIVSLRGADLTNAKLSGSILRGAELRGAYLINADLTGAQLGEADLRGSDFSKADLSNAVLVKANLKQAIFKEAKLREADLTDSKIEMIDISDADLTGAKHPPFK